MHEHGRESSAKRGYDRAWRQYRVYYLQVHPLCVDPYNFHLGRPTPARVVDHITPHKGDKTLFWDPNNHQALCKHCHDHKTASEDGGWGKAINMKNIVLIATLLLAGLSAAQTMTVVDSGKKQQSNTASFKVTPVRPLVITAPAEFEVVCDQPFSFQMTATGGKLPYAWTATGLPPGVTMSTTGVLSGTVPCSALPVGAARVVGMKIEEPFVVKK